MPSNSNFVLTNIVKKKRLRKVQEETLHMLSDAVSLTAGPYGSYSMILGDPSTAKPNEYSKDGHKVLKNIKTYQPLEMSIQQEMVEATTNIVKTVGDGTTSLVKLSYYIFKELSNLEINNPNIPTFKIVYYFKYAVNEIIKLINSQGRPITIEDIYNICMISTDGNEEISAVISQIYTNYGMDVYINLGISNTADHVLKDTSGLTLERGYSSPAYVNNIENGSGRCILRNPKVYCFEDPVDTPEMISFLYNIIDHNILSKTKTPEEYIPTLIMAPSISRDGSSFLAELEKMLYTYTGNLIEVKPPILIISGLSRDIDFYRDLCLLCKVPVIKKYIDPNIQQMDIDKGKAPTPETIYDWCGSVEEVISDSEITTFVNPIDMYTKTEEGKIKFSETYNGLIEFLNAEMNRLINDGEEDIGAVGSLRRRLRSLQSNYVEYFVGGIAVADRESTKDLVEDAVLNCRSASKYGVGYGANFEGLLASNKLINIIYAEDSGADETLKYIVNSIRSSFEKSLIDLYSSAVGKEDAESVLKESLKMGQPLNIRTMEYNRDVLCTINSDSMILDTISKLITIMFNTNQALLIDPLNNKYIDSEDL